MQNVKRHIAFKILSILLLVSILTPSVVKLAHVFENHKHEVCLNAQTTHFHTLDLECEFYKFKVNNTFTISTFNIKLVAAKKSQKPINSQYSFTSYYQPLAFSLRGPPLLV